MQKSLALPAGAVILVVPAASAGLTMPSDRFTAEWDLGFIGLPNAG